MRRALALSALLVSLSTGVATADGFHHIHLRVGDRAAARSWYLETFGGEPAKVGDLDAVRYGEVHILFLPAKDDAPSNQGSTLDHIGFSLANLDDKIEEFREAGVRVVQDVRSIGPIKYAFVEDPWGTRIEVLQDPTLYGFHHVHLHTPNPQIMLRWFADNFGGKPTRYFGLIPAIRYGETWFLAQQVELRKAPTIGRSVDHVGWLTDDLDATIAEFKTRGIEMDTEPEAFSGGRYCFLTGPDGLRFELVELKTGGSDE